MLNGAELLRESGFVLLKINGNYFFLTELICLELLQV